MKKRGDDYNAGANLTYEIVGAYKIRAPRFRFPPRDIALIASIADVGDNLAVNTAARDLVAFLIAECDRRKLGDYPTVMMLRTCLEMHRVEIDFVPFEDLGIAGGASPVPASPRPQLTAPLACRTCGCTDDNACPGGCAWYSRRPPLCTRCYVRGALGGLVAVRAAYVTVFGFDPITPSRAVEPVPPVAPPVAARSKPTAARFRSQTSTAKRRRRA